MEHTSISRTDLARSLIELGVRPGGVLVVHCAFSRVRPVEGGPAGLIAALESTLGPNGTLVMPSMSDDDDHPFDPRHSPCYHMGVVADAFRRMPGVLRSDSPHAFAAKGPKAGFIVAPHPLDVPHGLESPPGRVYELGGQVLLLGVGQDSNTTIHVAENMSGVRYRLQASVTILSGGRTERFHYTEVDHCCDRFSLVDGWLAEGGRLRRGTIGNAEARLMDSRDVVEAVVERLRTNETMFLHAIGHDVECDAARASLPDEGSPS